MKKSLFMLGLVLVSNLAQAQYFGLESSEWKYLYYNLGYATVNQISVAGDTTLGDFNAQVYHSFRTTYIPQQGGTYSTYSGTYVFGILRFTQDSVFHWKNGQYNLLYDFGAQIGDTWIVDSGPIVCNDSVAIVEVVGTGTMDVNGFQRRYIDLETNTDTWIGLSGRCIEGIGLYSFNGLSSTTGLGRGFLSGERWCDDIAVPEASPNIFICYSDSIVGTYDPFDTYCLYPSVEVGIMDFESISVDLYPNPAINLLQVSTDLPSGQTAQIHLMNYLGHRVLTKPINNGVSALDVSALAAGVYYYSVVVDGVIMDTGKQVIVR
jgi:hypothetical protein